LCIWTREITEAIEDTPLEFYELHLIPHILSSFQKQIDNSFWSAFPWCCTQTARRRQYLIQCRDRIITAVKEVVGKDPPELRLHPMTLCAAPDLQHLLQEEICFPAFSRERMPVRRGKR